MEAHKLSKVMQLVGWLTGKGKNFMILEVVGAMPGMMANESF